MRNSDLNDKIIEERNKIPESIRLTVDRFNKLLKLIDLVFKEETEDICSLF